MKHVFCLFELARIIVQHIMFYYHEQAKMGILIEQIQELLGQRHIGYFVLW